MATWDTEPVFDIEPAEDGTRIMLTSHGQEISLSTVRSRLEVEMLVQMLCRAAGLPEPWKKG